MHRKDTVYSEYFWCILGIHPIHQKYTCNSGVCVGRGCKKGKSVRFSPQTFQIKPNRKYYNERKCVIMSTLKGATGKAQMEFFFCCSNYYAGTETLSWCHTSGILRSLNWTQTHWFTRASYIGTRQGNKVVSSYATTIIAAVSERLANILRTQARIQTVLFTRSGSHRSQLSFCDRDEEGKEVRLL